MVLPFRRCELGSINSFRLVFNAVLIKCICTSLNFSNILWKGFEWWRCNRRNGETDRTRTPKSTRWQWETKNESCRCRHTNGPFQKYPMKLIINRVINLEHVSIIRAHVSGETLETANHKPRCISGICYYEIGTILSDRTCISKSFLIKIKNCTHVGRIGGNSKQEVPPRLPLEALRIAVCLRDMIELNVYLSLRYEPYRQDSCSNKSFQKWVNRQVSASETVPHVKSCNK